MSSTKNDDFITKISSLFEPKETEKSTISLKNNDTINVTSKKTTNNEFLGESNKFNNYNNLSMDSKKNSVISKPTLSTKKTSKITQSNKESLQDNDDGIFSFLKSSENKTLPNSEKLNNNEQKTLSIDKSLQDDKNLSQENKNIIKKTLEKTSMSIPTQGFNIKTILLWVGILILLAFLGFNIFSTLGNITDYLANIFKPILSLFGLATLDLTSKTLNVATEGTKDLANTTTNIFDSGLNLLNNTTQSGISILKDKISNNSGNISENDKSTSNESQSDSNDTLDKMDTYNLKDIDKLSAFIDSNFDNVNTFKGHNNKSCKSNCLKKCENESGSDKCNLHCDRYCDEVIPDPDPVIDNSRVQSKKTSGKSGFCYVGEENGIRSCVKVSKHDICTSGKIYSSKELCVNPKLRN